MRFMVKTTPETEALPIDVTGINNTKQDAYNALMKHGLTTIGAVLENWNRLDTFRGIGKTKAMHIRAAVFAWFVNNDPLDSLRRI